MFEHLRTKWQPPPPPKPGIDTFLPHSRLEHDTPGPSTEFLTAWPDRVLGDGIAESAACCAIADCPGCRTLADCALGVSDAPWLPARALHRHRGHERQTVAEIQDTVACQRLGLPRPKGISIIQFRPNAGTSKSEGARSLANRNCSGTELRKGPRAHRRTGLLTLRS
jgi:hypothetical protein